MTVRTHRRWFRFAFNLRTLFVVVTMICCWLGWQMQIVSQRSSTLRWLERRGGGPSNYGELLAVTTCLRMHGPVPQTFGGSGVEDGDELPLIRRLVGDTLIRFIHMPNGLRREDWLLIASAFPEASLFGFPPEGLTMDYREAARSK